jgi:hypothetical protein
VVDIVPIHCAQKEKHKTKTSKVVRIVLVHLLLMVRIRS